MANDLPTLEQLYRPHFRGQPTLQMSGALIRQAFCGRVDLPAGSATILVSTTLATSDALVLFGTQAPASTNVNSGQGRGIEVKSLNPGVGIVFGTQDGAGLSRATTIMWLLARTQSNPA